MGEDIGQIKTTLTITNKCLSPYYYDMRTSVNVRGDIGEDKTILTITSIGEDKTILTITSIGEDKTILTITSKCLIHYYHDMRIPPKVGGEVGKDKPTLTITSKCLVHYYHDICVQPSKWEGS